MKVLIFLACISYVYSDSCGPGDFPKEEPKTVIACERNNKHRSVSDAVLSCPANRVIIVTAANFGRTEPDSKVCPFGAHHRNYQNCKSKKTLAMVGSWCNNKKECKVQPTTHVFGDTCWGTYKYLDITYECIPAGDVKSVTACERNNFYRHYKDATLECHKGNIKINSANFGRTITSGKTCRWPFWHRNDVKCVSTTAINKVLDMCENKSKCNVAPTNKLFGDPCPGTYKYLDITYTCEGTE